MTVVVIAQVVCRYLLNNSLFWSEELERYMLVWLTFLGASVAYRRKMHPGVNILFKRLSPSCRRYTTIGVHLLSLFFFIIMVWYGCRFSYFVRLQTTTALSIPKWIIFTAVPLSGLLLSVHALAFLSNNLCRTSHKP